MIARRILFWLALAGLAVLGWHSVVPVWTQGLGGVTLDAQGQPGLWRFAAMVGVVFGAPLFLLDRGAGKVPVTVNAWQQALIVAFLTMSLILVLAMAGQPLRIWTLLSSLEWTSPIWRGAVGFSVSYGFLLLTAIPASVLEGAPSHERGCGFAKRAMRLLSMLGYVILLLQFPSDVALLAVCATPCLYLLVGTCLSDLKTELGHIKWLGFLLFIAALPRWEVWLRYTVLVPCALLTLLVGWRKGMEKYLKPAQAGVVICILVHLAQRAGLALTSPIALEWLVLAFAAGCGLLAGWLVRPRRSGASSPSDKEIFDHFAPGA